MHPATLPGLVQKKQMRFSVLTDFATLLRSASELNSDHQMNIPVSMTAAHFPLNALLQAQIIFIHFHIFFVFFRKVHDKDTSEFRSCTKLCLPLPSPKVSISDGAKSREPTWTETICDVFRGGILRNAHNHPWTFAGFD